MKDQIEEAIRHWWNDSMRKTWQTDLADPDLRHQCLDELADEIVRTAKGKLKGRGTMINDKKLESIKNPYAAILRELETGLWEHDVRVDDGIAKPYSYDDETFRACLKIFMSAIMWKLWEHMEKTEGMDKDKRIERVKKIGKAIRELIFENTGIDAHELY